MECGGKMSQAKGTTNVKRVDVGIHLDVQDYWSKRALTLI